MNNTAFVTIDGRQVALEGERNLLEVIHKAGIDLPTFCYHSDLSVYGACRLCLVDVEGRGIQGACSTPPEAGMKLRTTTAEIREIRKIAVELLLANHDQSCPTCPKSANCKLQNVARQLGIQKVRFKPVHAPEPVDCSSPALLRDPNKCVLCGDCVRMCSEIQSVGAIDFVYRGHEAAVAPAFGKGLVEVECINCGQCASVCPTGSLVPKPETDEVWQVLHDPSKKVVAQVAPAVRVALGECFGMAPGTITAGQIVAAMRMLGFEHVYDTSFAADLTVIEEGTEFLGRRAAGERLPLFTSCCPGWVSFAEQYYPELLGNLSTCRSPQQMLGSLLKEALPGELGITRHDLVVVSVMPCTAKKSEARLEKFAVDGSPDVDYVLTTVELARMIQAAGIRFHELQPEPFDMPFGFTTGAGVLFGNSGGVTEAVLRFATEAATGKPLPKVEFQAVRGQGGMREAAVPVGEETLRVVVVHGLRNARAVADMVKAGKSRWDLIEVMACPGGCVSGGGQPVAPRKQAREQRAQGLYGLDRTLQLQKSQDNVFVRNCYAKLLSEPGGQKAHKLLHTHFQGRQRISGGDFSLLGESDERRPEVSVCLGTNCFLKGSDQILRGLLRHAEERGLAGSVDIRASFCFEQCEHGPTVIVDGTRLQHATLETATEALDALALINGKNNGTHWKN